MTQLFLQRLPTNAQLILASSKDTLDTESLANSAKIATYGTRSLTLNLGLRRSFPWLFTLADVNHAIIGADFLRHFNLLVDLRLRKRSLIDAVTHFHINGITSPLPALSPVYAALPSTPFTKILQEYSDITRPTTKQTAVKHNVAHHIVTRGPPCSARPRRLPPERLKVAKNEFQHMLDGYWTLVSFDHQVALGLLPST